MEFLIRRGDMVEVGVEMGVEVEEAEVVLILVGAACTTTVAETTNNNKQRRD